MHKPRCFYTLLIWLMLVCVQQVWADEADMAYLQGLANTQYHQLQSAIVERPYHVYVKLPGTYQENPDKHYPTVYLLDGGVLFPLLASYTHYLGFAQELPDLIVIGISYGADRFQDGNLRSTDYTAPSAERDYWGGAAAFQRVLADELFPLIESRYRSDAARRVVFGQSLGGQFVLFTASTRPDLFWGHIASNPALHRNLRYFLENPKVADNPQIATRLYVASAEFDDARFRGPALSWMNYWAVQPNKPWDLKVITLDGATHLSAAPDAFRLGVRWLTGQKLNP